MLARRPIHTSLLGHGARELELGQRDGELFGGEAGRARELVGARRCLTDAREHDARRRADLRLRASAATRPKLSSTSWAQVSGVAPSLSRAFEPAESALVISPGTAKTSLPSSSAKSAVISAPLRSRASTTTDAEQRPATIRFRAGKRHGAGSTPGAYSETTRPLAADLSSELAVGRRVVAVDAAAEHGDGDPACLERAAMSFGIDSAREAADDDEAGRGELAREHSRDLPSIGGTGSGTDDRHCRQRQQARIGVPAEKEPGGGSWIARSSGGKAVSERPRKRMPSACRRSSSADERRTRP